MSVSDDPDFTIQDFPVEELRGLLSSTGFHLQQPDQSFDTIDLDHVQAQLFKSPLRRAGVLRPHSVPANFVFPTSEQGPPVTQKTTQRPRLEQPDIEHLGPHNLSLALTDRSTEPKSKPTTQTTTGFNAGSSTKHTISTVEASKLAESIQALPPVQSIIKEQTNRSPKTTNSSTPMAAIVATVVPIVAEGIKTLYPIVAAKLQSLVQQAVASFEAAHPGQSIWQVFGAAIMQLWRDNHIDQKIYNALNLGAFVAKISNFSQKLITFAHADPDILSPSTLVQHWDTTKLIGLIAGDPTIDAATVRKNMLKADPVGTMVGLLDKDKITLPGANQDIKQHVMNIFNHFMKEIQPKKPPPLPASPAVPASATNGLANGDTSLPASESSNKPQSGPTNPPAATDKTTQDAPTPVPTPKPAASASEPQNTPQPPIPTAKPASPAVPTPAHDPLSKDTAKPGTSGKTVPAAGTTSGTATAPTSETAPKTQSSTAVKPAVADKTHLTPDSKVSSPSSEPLPAQPDKTKPIPPAVAPAAAPAAAALKMTPVAPLDPPPEFTPQWLAAHPEAMADIPEKEKPDVLKAVNALLRIRAISPSTTAMEELMRQKAPSSKAIIRNSKSAWVSKNQDALGVEDAQTVYNNAQDQVIRLENMSIGLLQFVKGSGLAPLDDGTSPAEQRINIQEHISKRGYNLSLENLFGGMDDATAPDSRTVYSPAAYFVELLGYLRNNNMDPNAVVSDTSPKGQADSLEGTVLQHLFRRRPDLGNLELTAENSDTVLPYIDLVNEVMESFIVNLPAYKGDGNDPKQADIDVYNVTTTDSEELLSQPQNINMAAYRQVAAAAHPTSLPYNQPLDAQRVFLNFLKLKRSDLVDTFRPKPPALTSAAMTAALAADPKSNPLNSLTLLQRVALDRQVDCEELGLVQEEYLILTKQVFWPVEFFELTEATTVQKDDYTRRIGLKSVPECWGYTKMDTLLSTNKSKQDGLQFVEKQLLPRSGIAYTDLIEIVQTSFVNPNFPSGRDKTILDSLRFSYGFLSTLVNEGTSSEAKYGSLADFLTKSTKILNLADALSDTINAPVVKKDMTGQNSKHIKSKVIRDWVLTRFEQMGNVIVLDGGEGPQLEVTGVILATRTDAAAAGLPIMANNTVGVLTSGGKITDVAGTEYSSGPIGILDGNGAITDGTGVVSGRITISGRAIFGNPVYDDDYTTKFPNISFSLTASGNTSSAWTIAGGVLKQTAPLHIVEWTMDSRMGGSASLEDVQLIHLNGKPLAIDEWDRLHRFIRIWRRLGWSVIETDRALTSINSSLSPLKSPIGMTALGTNGNLDGDAFDELITFDNFSDNPLPSNGSSDNSGVIKPLLPDITPEVIHQLAAVSQILQITSLSVEQLLTFWTNLSSRGTSSLYYRLFFTRRASAGDLAFAPDINGDYFTGKNTTISDHHPAVMAAFSMQSTDIDILLGLTEPGISPIFVPNVLNMENLSAIYRANLLVRTLGVGIKDLAQVAATFVDPPPGPSDCLGALFSKPSDVLNILRIWKKIGDASFAWSELRYIVNAAASPLDPLAPTEIDALKISKTLHDGILAIQAANPFITDEANATDSIIQSKAALVFDAATVTQILNLIHGTTVYTTSAPAIKDPQFPVEVTKNVAQAQYILGPQPAPGSSIKQSAKLQITGILSTADAKTLKEVARPYSPLPNRVNGIQQNGSAKAESKAAEASDNVQDQWEDSVER
jgi:hypothetical protein